MQLYVHLTPVLSPLRGEGSDRVSEASRSLFEPIARDFVLIENCVLPAFEHHFDVAPHDRIPPPLVVDAPFLAYGDDG